MILNVYSIYDSKSGVYSRPFFSLNNATAIRSFVQVANDQSTEIARHSADFSLHLIGTFDDTTAELVDDNHKTNLGLAASFKE